MVRYTPSVAGDPMVDEVTRVERTGTGSATPSPSASPKVTRWEQLDPTARTGAAPAPVEPVAAPTPTRSETPDGAPRVRPLELPETAKPPRVNFGGERFGFTKTDVKGFPYGIRNTPEWRVGSGKNPLSRGATGLLNLGAQYGKPDPRAQFRGGKAAAAMFGIMSVLNAVTASSEGDVVNEQTNTTLNEDLAQYYEDLGYPKDIAQQMGKDQMLTTNLIGIFPGLGAAAAVDVGVGAIGAGIGAAAGSVVPGIGTAAGAAAGWSIGTTISGISTLVNLFIEPFTKKAGVDIPTVDDFWLAKDIYGAAGEFSFSAAETAIQESAYAFHPDRLRSPSEVMMMEKKVIDGTYATGKEPDPRGQEMADLVAQGYFIKTKADGTQGIDILAYQQYQLDTMRYKQPQDTAKYLPKTKADPREMTENEWIRLWSNAE